MDNPFKSPAVLSICPGILGIERGLKRAGVNCRVAAYVEIEAFIIANLVAGMEAGLLDPTPIWTDAKTFDARPFRGRIHAVTGGYPCTPFSLAGARSGENHSGHIYPSISGTIEATGPVWCFFENVDDHLTLGFDKVYQDLHRLGYSVETGIYTAEEVGAPHERERMFILAVANSDCYGYGAGTRKATGSGSQAESKAQRKEWNDLLRQWMWDVIRDSSKKVVNADIEGLEGFGMGEVGAGTKLPLSTRSGSNRFPARPGEQQYEWEEPRTIESGMGCTVNGYSFREDLLRSLGNSVVEQTAELAFIDLLKKHLVNLEKSI